MSFPNPLRENDPIVRLHTAAQWTAADYQLQRGELGIESDTGKQKAGIGKKWSATPYFTPSGASVEVTFTDASATLHNVVVVGGLITSWTTE